MLYYQNKNGRMICSKLEINNSKLKDVIIINCLETAEKQFRINNSMDEEDGVFIPEITEEDGDLYAEDLNTYLYKVEETIEDFINEYDPV